MEDPDKFYSRARQNYPGSATSNTIDELLLAQNREQERKHYDKILQAEMDERSARLYQQAQRNQLYNTCSFIVCLGCCCALIYNVNQTFALSRKCHP